MPSRADVQAFNRTTRDLTTVVRAELTRFWAGIDTSTPESARAALDTFMPALVQTYGQAAALVAANYYDDIRAHARVRSSFTAVMADPAPTEQVQGSNRWAVAPIAAGNAAQALANAQAAASRLVLQPARLTVSQNIGADPGRPRWARVPSGRETCAFCLLLASRGAVYSTDRHAGRMNDYHSDCDCVPTPFFGDEPYPDGYDPDRLYEKYAAARDTAAGHSTKAVLAELRAQQGIA